MSGENDNPRSPLSRRNPRVVCAAKLHRASARRAAGEFLAEGANSVEAALDAGRVVQLLHRERPGGREAQLVARAETLDVPVYQVDERAAVALGDTVTPPGLVAVCRIALDTPAQVVARSSGMLAVAVDIGDPGNAGTLIRLADACGVDAVIFAGRSVDPHNGKCVRAAAGSLFHVPLARTDDVRALVGDLRAAGMRTLATAVDGELALDDADEVFTERTAWLFGSEAHGLDADVAARADHRVRIPMSGRAESLNLAAAAAICLYAGSRVRHRR